MTRRSGLKLAAWVALGLLAAWGAGLVGRGAAAAQAEGAAAGGRPVVLPNFERERRHIRYTVPQSGRDFWLSSLAGRFGYCGGWEGIAAETLRGQGVEPDRKAIEDFQYKVDVGTQLRIPLKSCK